MQLSRRGFIKLTATGLAASSLGALGFGGEGKLWPHRCGRSS